MRCRCRQAQRARARAPAHALAHALAHAHLRGIARGAPRAHPARRGRASNLRPAARRRWRPFRDALKPVFEKLYHSVESGEETRRTLDANSRASYKADLDKELAELANSEMWRAGKAVRALRPENLKKK